MFCSFISTHSGLLGILSEYWVSSFFPSYINLQVLLLRIWSTKTEQRSHPWSLRHGRQGPAAGDTHEPNSCKGRVTFLDDKTMTSWTSCYCCMVNCLYVFTCSSFTNLEGKLPKSNCPAVQKSFFCARIQPKDLVTAICLESTTSPGKSAEFHRVMMCYNSTYRMCKVSGMFDPVDRYIVCFMPFRYDIIIIYLSGLVITFLHSDGKASVPFKNQC